MYQMSDRLLPVPLGYARAHVTRTCNEARLVCATHAGWALSRRADDAGVVGRVVVLPAETLRSMRDPRRGHDRDEEAVAEQTVVDELLDPPKQRLGPLDQGCVQG